MSYILDALRKADAERERDPARGIHAQPAVLPAPARKPWAVIAGGALAGLAAVAVAAYALRTPSPEPAPATLGPSLAIGPAPVAAPAPAVIQVATSVQPPAPEPLPVAPVPPKVAVAAAVLKPPAATKPAAAASEPATKVAAPASAPAAGAADRIVAQAELPADVQRELPKLAISGGVYSDNPAQRMLIVGGQVVNEGAELATGVVLEQIRNRSAVLRFRGWRYSVGY